MSFLPEEILITRIILTIPMIWILITMVFFVMRVITR
jgi:hypothetical protein